MRQSFIAICAMLLVLAVAAYDDFRRKDSVPKVRISGTVTQLTSLERSDRDKAVSFRVGTFPFDLGLDAQALALLGRHGVAQPFNVGARVEAIVAKADVVARDGNSPIASTSTTIPVLALIVEGKAMLGSPEALRVAPSMHTWPYLLLLSVAGAGLFLGHKRRRRRSRRT